jgi:hypothetical protein
VKEGGTHQNLQMFDLMPYMFSSSLSIRIRIRVRVRIRVSTKVKVRVKMFNKCEDWDLILIRRRLIKRQRVSE